MTMKKDLIKIGASFVIYFLAASVGLYYADVNESVSSIWPATGIAFAMIYTQGYSTVIGVFLGAVSANYLNVPNFGLAVMIAVGNALEGFVAVFMIKQYTRNFFISKFGMYVFAFICVGFATAISATIGVGALAVFNRMGVQGFADLWAQWWLGDAAGQAVVAPILVANYYKRFSFYRIDRFLRLGLIAIATISISHLVFISNPGNSYAWIGFVIVSFAAFEFRASGVTIISFIIAIYANYATDINRGPFASEGLLSTQLYIICLSLTGLFISSIVYEYKLYNKAIEEIKESILGDK